MTEAPTPQTTGRVQRFSYASFGEPEALPATKPQPAEEKKPGDPPAQAAPLPPPPAPVFTEKDIQAARNEGKKQGIAEGTADAETKINKEATAREEAISKLLDVIANRITIAAESHTTYLKGQEEIMGRLILAIARKICGEVLEAEPYAHVQSLLQECMGIIAGASKIMIVVAPTRSVDLKRRIDTLKPKLQGFEGELLIEESETLGEQDCRVEWKDGYGERNIDALWKSIEAVILDKTILAKKQS